jgi:hypothetical protein
LGTERRSTRRAPTLAAALARAHAGDAQAWDDFAALRDEARGRGQSSLALLAAAGLVVTGHHPGRFDNFRACVEELLPLRSGAQVLGGNDELLALRGLLLGLLLSPTRATRPSRRPQRACSRSSSRAKTSA